MLNHEHGRVGDLYVAMTRPTQRLRLIAAAGVPAGIEELSRPRLRPFAVTCRGAVRAQASGAAILLT